MTSSGDFISTLAGNQSSLGKNEKRCLSSSISSSFPMETEQGTVKLDTWNIDKNLKRKSLFDNHERSRNIKNY